MRDLVVHPESGLTLDFAEDDFGGPEQAAVIESWLAGWRPQPRDLICYQHRNHEHPGLYLQQRGDLLIAAHWPGSKLAGTHEIRHGPSDEHKRQVEYIQVAGVAAGLKVETEVPLRSAGRIVARADAVIYGPRVQMSVEVQRSALSRTVAKGRTTKARRAGLQPVWFADSQSNPGWFGHVPGVRMNPEVPWDTLPSRRSVQVVSGVPAIIGRRCRNMRNSVCPDRPYGCNRWHPDYEPRAILVDELAELVPAGELVTMLFRVPSGREHVFIVSPNDKSRYEAITGRSADVPLSLSKREQLEQAERIVCNSDAGKAVKPSPLEPSTTLQTSPVSTPDPHAAFVRVVADLRDRYEPQEDRRWARPAPALVTTLSIPDPLLAKPLPSTSEREAMDRLFKASQGLRRARSAGMRRYWQQEAEQCQSDLRALRNGRKGVDG